jgi:hypothetical protein
MNEDALFGTTWVHVFEEDTAEGMAFRPETANVPLSRRPRERIVFNRDRSATYFTPGPDDRGVPRTVTWSDRDEASEPADADRTAIRVLEQSPSRLVVRIP